jgi:hypothetical protein
VTFLVIHQKHKKSLEEITNDLCPVLSVQQLYRISTMYWDDRYNTETVSHEVQPFPYPPLKISILTSHLSMPFSICKNAQYTACTMAPWPRLIEFLLASGESNKG